jgi:hypothetical protein
MTEQSNAGANAADIQTEEDLPEEAKQVVADMRGRYKKIAIFFDEDFGLVVIAKQKGAAGEANYQRFVNELQDPEVDKALAMKTFALACTVHPKRDDAKRIFEDNPAFALKVAGRAQKLAGSGVKELGKA